MSVVERLGARVRSVRSDPVLVNSALIFTTTSLMAAGGAVFWVVAARLSTPDSVGLAGSLVSASDSLALFAQLGLNITLLQTMPISTRRAGDVVVSSLIVATAGLLLGLGYAGLLPFTSPRIHDVLHEPLLVLLFALLVAGSALNVLTDSIFLAIDRVWSYLHLNGIGLGLVKCALPLGLATAGAVGLYSSYAGAATLCAVASVFVILRQVPGSRRVKASPELRGAKRFAGAGYATYVLNVMPQLVLPLLVINELGAADAGVYFISGQIAGLLNSIVFAVGNSMYAEAERTPHQRRAVVRRGGVTLIVCAGAAGLVMFLAAPLFLAVFGSHYTEQGTTTLRVMSVAVLAVAFNYWSAIRLRIVRYLPAMILVQLTCTALVLGLSAVFARFGTEWVAVSWGVGQLAGGLAGLVVSSLVRPLEDAPLEEAPQEELQEDRDA